MQEYATYGSKILFKNPKEIKEKNERTSKYELSVWPGDNNYATLQKYMKEKRKLRAQSAMPRYLYTRLPVDFGVSAKKIEIEKKKCYFELPIKYKTKEYLGLSRIRAVSAQLKTEKVNQNIKSELQSESKSSARKRIDSAHTKSELSAHLNKKIQQNNKKAIETKPPNLEDSKSTLLFFFQTRQGTRAIRQARNISKIRDLNPRESPKTLSFFEDDT